MQQSLYQTSCCRGNRPMRRRGNVAVTVAAFWLWLGCSSVTLAQTETSKPPLEFPNPLESTTPDPLLPNRSLVDQPLTLAERLKLQAALNALDAEATAKLQAGDRLGAFDIWNRELRLQRVIGLLAEVEALGRVGAIAWSEDQRPEVQIITQRLQAIQVQTLCPQPVSTRSQQAQPVVQTLCPPSAPTQPQPTVDLQLLQALGQAYQQLRSPKQALEVYQKILEAQRSQNPVVAEATLKTIAELHLSWFDYSQAATSYEQLLSLAKAKRDRTSEVTYLQQLAFIYEQAKRSEQAAATRQQLAELYLNEKDFTQVPELRLEIASDYESLGQTEQAFQNYQEAYASAWALQQYYRAAEALRKLVALYSSQNQSKDALATSQILLEADRRASNVYGMMNTYDQIGQIYVKSGNYPEALAAFQKGLELANQLQHQEKYFAAQIQQVNQQIKK